ncbi:helix-turn-helix transcriptional regulator [Aureimonas leprariae]|uniref:Helix-turn-helix domain-containing protein n=1 Tax=Plantimonas leprariae TaxID=2615207 RepID=A0A7V7TUM3_9HYPH|nr:helix-turn-helix transcriptional regulator [Aureimonas leprariae]KAB0676312.1 helix-turn-helix domain-containing protein [Aureimonas leprariae]
MDDVSELGAFLRSRRERLRPDDLDLPTLRRRRTTGLRREEVAQRAGISTEWYVKLEQGRSATPSDETVAALALALRLTAAEAAHLRRLTGGDRPSRFEREEVPAALRRLVESLPEPAYVTGQRWDLLAWNRAAADLFGDFGSVPAGDRNILLHVLTDPAGRRLFGNGWNGEARRMAALFRATFDLWPGDAAFADLVGRLRDDCPEFEPWWTAHDVGEPSAGTKLLHHPKQGPVRYGYATFQSNDDPRLKLAIYTRIGE